MWHLISVQQTNWGFASRDNLSGSYGMYLGYVRNESLYVLNSRHHSCWPNPQSVCTMISMITVLKLHGAESIVNINIQWYFVTKIVMTYFEKKLF